MTLQTIDVGATVGDATADTLRAGLIKANDNFAELYAAAQPLGTGAQTIASSGQYYLTGTVSSLSVTANDVEIIGNNKTVTKLLNTGLGNKFSNFLCGNPAATDPTATPATTPITSLASYIAWSKKPAQFTNVTFVGDSPTGTQVGLLLGENGAVYQADSTADCTGCPRIISRCRWVNCGVGLVVLPKIEYYAISNCDAHFNGMGMCIMGGNTTVSDCRITHNREGLRFSYPKTSGLVTFAWTGELTSPTTFTDGTSAGANSFHSQANNCLINHNGYGLSAWEATGATDPEVYSVRVSQCQFQASEVADVMCVGTERLRVYNSYLRGTVRAQSSGLIFLHNSKPLTITELTSGLVYQNTYIELSADPNDPPEGMYTLWQSDGTGSGDDGDMMMKITAGGVTKTITLVDFSAS